MGPKSNDTTVQGTNDCSVLSKHSMCHAGYKDDNFLECFTLKSAPRRAPLINRGYYIRMQAVETLLTHFLQVPSKKQIISLGAGFDTIFFRLFSQLGKIVMQDIYVVEIDFPELVARKEKLIAASGSTYNIINELEPLQIRDPSSAAAVLNTDSYCLLGADLSCTDELLRLFSTETCLDKAMPTLVLSECVMTYMEHERSTKLIKCLQNYFSNCLFVTYEQIKPWDAFGQFMRTHFDKLNSSLKAITTYTTKSKQSERYSSCGFGKVDVFTMHQFYMSLSTSELNRIAQLEYFDEFEEWHLKCDHYIIIAARNSDIFPAVDTFLQRFEDKSNADREANTTVEMTPYLETEDSHAEAEQFAHASAVACLDEGGALVLVHGGFGAADGKHSRLSELRAYSIADEDPVIQKLTVMNCCQILPCRLHHTITTLSNNRIFVFGGRLSPSKPLADPVILSIRKQPTGHIKTELRPVTSNGSTMTSRWRHAAVSFTINTKEYVLVTGGLTVDKSSGVAAQIISLCQIYSVTDDTWTRLPDMPCPIHSHSMCYVDKCHQVYCIGGLTDAEQVVDKCYRLEVSLDTTEWQWEEVTLDLISVYSHSTLTFHDKILIVGGIDRHGQQVGVQVVDISATRTPVHIVHLPVSVSDSLVMYFNHTSHIVSVMGKQYLIIIGGGGNCFSFGTHINKRILWFPLDQLQMHKF